MKQHEGARQAQILNVGTVTISRAKRGRRPGEARQRRSRWSGERSEPCAPSRDLVVRGRTDRPGPPGRPVHQMPRPAPPRPTPHHRQRRRRLCLHQPRRPDPPQTTTNHLPPSRLTTSPAAHRHALVRWVHTTALSLPGPRDSAGAGHQERPEDRPQARRLDRSPPRRVRHLVARRQGEQAAVGDPARRGQPTTSTRLC